MKSAKLQNVARIVIVMAVLCGLCAPAAQAKPAKNQLQIPEQSQEYKKGIALDDGKRYDEARKFFEAGVEKGDPWCMQELGMYYRGGFGGLKEDLARSFALRSKAAELNVPDANYYLALDYLNGWSGVPEDSKKAKEFLMKSAMLGGAPRKVEHEDYAPDLIKKYLKMPEPSDEYKKGEALLFDGKNFIDGKNDKEARQYFKAGAKKGDPWCMFGLGVYCAEPVFVQEDIARCWLELLNKAAAQNVPEAYWGLSFIYLQDERDIEAYGVAGDTKKGIEFMTKAAELNYPYANFLLGSLYENGFEVVEQNFQTALNYYQKARKLGCKGLDNKIYNLEHLPDIALALDEFWQAYEENIVAADKSFRGKTIRINGSISEIGMDSGRNPYVILSAAGIVKKGLKLGAKAIGIIKWWGFGISVPDDAITLNNVQFFFDKERIDDVTALKKGASVIIQGVIKGLSDEGNVVIEHCWVVHED